ncbi:MAG TPA: phosphopyruvate hydratase [Rhizomicrobium sp.]|nr:phosphopyruvate hydratase [Rhizomicrobium sp.]
MKSRIASVTARQIWDSRGRPTVEAEVALEGGARGRAAAPAGASRGRNEAIDLRDGGARFGGFGVSKAVANVNGALALTLAGQDAANQAEIDRSIAELDGTPNLTHLGGNACVAVSLAVLHAAAAAEGLPLWRYLARGTKPRMPLPEIQIFGGGAHAGRRIDIQDLMIMVPGAGSVAEALEVTADVYRAAGDLMSKAGKLAGTADEGGWWPSFGSNEEALETLTRSIEASGHRPGHDVFISLDIAASEFYDNGRYRLALDGTALDRDAMADLIEGWARRFPILSIEDPAAQDDAPTMLRITRSLSEQAQIIGDDFLVTDARRVEESGGACTAVLIKVNQAGTVSKAKSALDAGKARGWATIVSARSGETEDTSIVDLAVGWDAGQLKVGSFARSERMAKWNELLRIEEAMGADARFAGWSAFPAAMKKPAGAAR